MNREITQKVKSAIKAKLCELKSYIDDYLPDYIIVMIANKKSQQGMADDLQLFLGDKTIQFTDWLFDVLGKLHSMSENVTEIESIDQESTALVTDCETTAGVSLGTVDEMGETGAAVVDPVKSPPPKSAITEDELLSTPSAVVQGNIENMSIPTTEPEVVTLKTETVENSSVELQDDGVDIAETEPTTTPLVLTRPPPVGPVLTRPLGPLMGDESGEALITLTAELDDPLAEELDTAEKILPAKIKIAKPTASVKAEQKTPGPDTVVHKDLRFKLKNRQAPPSQNVSQVQPAMTVLTGAESARILTVKNEPQPSQVVTKLKDEPSLYDPTNPAMNVTVSSGQRKRKVLNSVVEVQAGNELSDVDDEDEYYKNTHHGSVASIIRIPERRPSVPSHRQATKNLIVKAINQAEQSTSAVRNLPSNKMIVNAGAHHYPPPAKLARANITQAVGLTRPQAMRVEVHQTEQPSNNVIIEPLHITTSNSRLPVSHHDITQPSANYSAPLSGPINDVSGQIDDDDRDSAYEEELLSLEHIHAATKRKLTADSSLAAVNTSESPPITKRRLAVSSNPPVASDSKTRFFVTLTGVEEMLHSKALTTHPGLTDELDLLDHQSAGYDVMDTTPAFNNGTLSTNNQFHHSEQMDEDVVYSEDDGEGEDYETKKSQRCRFWPSCRKADQCPFHHPNTPCRLFPNCQYGDKCYYIHPNCKFDALCTKKDCPFTHASQRLSTAVPSMISSPVIKVVQAPSTASTQNTQPCRFYPNCLNKNCPFFHPKECRFGADCKRADCMFGHPPVKKNNMYRWTATSKQTVQDTAAQQPTTTTA